MCMPPPEDKCDDPSDISYEELRLVYDHFHDYHMMFNVQFIKSVFVTFVTMDMSRISLQSYKSIDA
jgi:hypothetical protein